jgi:mRNA interferase MazF
MARTYVPDAGDVVWLDFNPQSGREQGGHRPALVLSPVFYNARSSLMICCPITTRIKNYPFEVALAGVPASAVLADHVKSVDWRTRRARWKSRVSAEELEEVRAKVRSLIGAVSHPPVG